MLKYHRQRWPNIKSALGQHSVLCSLRLLVTLKETSYCQEPLFCAVFEEMILESDIEIRVI